jgi:hypothetical protein
LSFPSPALSFRWTVILAGVCAFATPLQAQKSQHFTLTDRNLLTGRFDSLSVAQALVSPLDWVPYPRLNDRNAWSKIPELVREAHIAEAESLIGVTWPTLPATLFLEFDRMGNRTNYQNRRNVRRKNLANLVLGEVFENEGRFLDDIANGIWAISEETYWGVPAHLDIQSAGFGLPDVDEPTVDLFAAETAGLMAWTLYLLGDRLNEVSPLVTRRIRSELKRRVLDPNLNRDDFWWMALEPSVINNWTPWVNSNWLTVVLIAEEDPTRRSAAVWKIMRSVDVFLNSYPDDGGCDEGPLYWTRAGGSLLEVLELLRSGTNGLVDIYDEPLVEEIGRYILKGYVGGDYFINFADARPVVAPPAAIVFRYGSRIDDPSLMQFASSLAERQELGSGYIEGVFGHLGRQLMTMFELSAMVQMTSDVVLPMDVWLPDTEVMTARSHEDVTQGLFVAVKAGHNEENHNHNDVGNFILYSEGVPAIIDLGPGTYTKATFGDNRYSLWNLQSGYHNVPTVNGYDQPFGSDHRAENVSYVSSPDSASISMDISAAYPPEAGVEVWNRTVTLRRSAYQAEVFLTEDLERTKTDHSTALNLMTNRRAVMAGDNAIQLDHEDRAGLLSPVYVLVNPDQVDVSIEVIPITDAGLARSWGAAVTRMVLTLRDEVAASDRIEIKFTLEKPGRDQD